jgi:hypothetical protein
MMIRGDILQTRLEFLVVGYIKSWEPVFDSLMLSLNIVILRGTFHKKYKNLVRSWHGG